MRTTIDIDDEILHRLKSEAHRARVPLRQTINRVLRLGLERLHPPSTVPYRCPTFSMGFPPTANLDKALELAAQLEEEAILPKQTRPK